MFTYLFQVKDVSPLDQVNLVSYEELNVLIDFLDKECARISKMADQLASCSDKEVMSALRPKQLMQAVKAITTFLGQVETLDITAACDECLKACLEFDKAKGNFDFFLSLQRSFIIITGFWVLSWKEYQIR